MNDQEKIMQTLILIAQQGGSYDETKAMMIKYLVDNGLDEERANEFSEAVLQRMASEGSTDETSPESPYDGEDNYDEEVEALKCGGTIKNKKAKKACNGVKISKKALGGRTRFEEMTRLKDLVPANTNDDLGKVVEKIKLPQPGILGSMNEETRRKLMEYIKRNPLQPATGRFGLHESLESINGDNSGEYPNMLPEITVTPDNQLKYTRTFRNLVQ